MQTQWFIAIFILSMTLKMVKQECIPVGCVPPARYRMGVSLTKIPLLNRGPWTKTPHPLDLDKDPLDRDSRDPPWTETHPGQRPPCGQTPVKTLPSQTSFAGSNKEQDFVHQRNTDFTQHFGNSFGKSFFFWGWLCVILLSISGNGYLEAILFQQLKCAIVSVFQESECLMIRYGRN